MESRTKRKRRSSILKKSPHRKSLVDADINTEYTATTQTADEDRRSMRRKVSFANTLEVKEISRVADIAEKWPDSSSSDVDTTNISDLSKLSCSVPCKKTNHEPDITSLLSAPIVQTGVSSSTLLNTMNDSNMDLTMASVSTTNILQQSIPAAATNTAVLGDLLGESTSISKQITDLEPASECLSSEGKSITIPSFLNRVTAAEVEDIDSFFSSDILSGAQVCKPSFLSNQPTNAVDFPKVSSAALDKAENNGMELTCMKMVEVLSKDSDASVGKAFAAGGDIDSSMHSHVPVRSFSRHLSPLIESDRSADLARPESCTGGAPHLPKFLSKSDSTAVAPNLGESGSHFHPSASEQVVTRANLPDQEHAKSKDLPTAPSTLNEDILSLSRGPASRSEKDRDELNSTVLLDESMQMTIQLRSSGQTGAEATTLCDANESSGDLEMTCAVNWNRALDNNVQANEWKSAFPNQNESAEVIDPVSNGSSTMGIVQVSSSENLSCLKNAPVRARQDSDELDFTCNIGSVKTSQALAADLDASQVSDNLSFTCKLPSMSGLQNYSTEALTVPSETVADLLDPALANLADAEAACHKDLVSSVDAMLASSSATTFIESLPSVVANKENILKSSVNSNFDRNLEQFVKNFDKDIDPRALAVLGGDPKHPLAAIADLDMQGMGAGGENAYETAEIKADVPNMVYGDDMEITKTSKSEIHALSRRENSQSDETTVPKFHKLARARNSVGLYKSKLLSAGVRKQTEKDDLKQEFPCAVLHQQTSLPTSYAAGKENGTDTRRLWTVDHEAMEVIERGAVHTPESGATRAASPDHEETAKEIHSQKTYSNTQPSPSMQVDDDVSAQDNTLLSKKNNEGESNVDKHSDNMFQFALDNCGNVNGKSMLLEQSSVLEPSIGMKRSSTGSGMTTDGEDVIPAKKREVEEFESSLGATRKAEQKKEDDAKSKDAQNPQDPFSILTESILLQKDLSDSISVQEFLFDYTDVRIGTFRKASKGRRSTFMPPGSNKKPEGLDELATAVFVDARSVPVYRQFIDSIQLKFKSLQEEIDKQEAAIKAKNTELMTSIRVGAEEESDELREEVESLASKCSQLAKLAWKQNKSKLMKAMGELKAQTIEKDLQPIVSQVQRTGNVEELLNTMVAQLEVENSRADEVLRELQSHKEIPSNEQAAKFKKSKEEISQLTEKLQKLRVVQQTQKRNRKERKMKMQKIWELVDLAEANEKEAESKRSRIKKDLEIHRRFLHWEIMRDDADKIEFGFVNKTLLISASYDPDDDRRIQFYRVENRFSEAKWAPMYRQLYDFALRIFMRNVDADSLLKLASTRKELPKAINFVAKHATKVKHLTKQLLEVMCMVGNVGLIFKQDSIVVDFDGDVPDLCSFQVEFVFVDTDTDEPRLSFTPIRYHLLDSPTSYGKVDKEVILNAMSKVSATSPLYFSKLIHAVLSVITSAKCDGQRITSCA